MTSGAVTCWSRWAREMSGKSAATLRNRGNMMSSAATMRIATSNPFAGLEEVVSESVPLAPRTWYKIGGPARWLIQPRTPEELQETAQRCTENEIPIFVLGL